VQHAAPDPVAQLVLELVAQGPMAVPMDSDEQVQAQVLRTRHDGHSATVLRTGSPAREEGS
jgi:hypothetical protein